MRARQWVSRHLAACPECAREERALRKTSELIGALPPMKLNPRTRTRLVDRFREEHGHNPKTSTSDPPGSSARSSHSTRSTPS
jgi:anti-sigma factor RsiW